MSVELNSLHFPGRDTQVESSARLNHVGEAIESSSPPININCISVSAKTEVLQRMQAREGVSHAVEAGMILHDVRLHKFYSWHFRIHRSKIEHFNFSESSHVRDKSVYGRAHVNVTPRRT